jgi:PHD/YefM family antitoxin component YafN of YafNO toxin-antitoxin module
MIATVKQISENAEKYFSNVLKNNSELIIGSSGGNVVVVSETEWNQLNETVRLLTDKISLKSLFDGYQARLDNSEIRHYSIEEVFHDL